MGSKVWRVGFESQGLRGGPSRDPGSPSASAQGQAGLAVSPRGAGPAPACTGSDAGAAWCHGPGLNQGVGSACLPARLPRRVPSGWVPLSSRPLEEPCPPLVSQQGWGTGAPRLQHDSYFRGGGLQVCAGCGEGSRGVRSVGVRSESSRVCRAGLSLRGELLGGGLELPPGELSRVPTVEAALGRWHFGPGMVRASGRGPDPASPGRGDVLQGGQAWRAREGAPVIPLLTGILRHFSRGKARQTRGTGQGAGLW